MRILFASEKPHIPVRIDGSLMAVHDLLTLLQEEGHECPVVSNVGEFSPWLLFRYRALRALTGRKLRAATDRINGYPTRRAWGDLVVPETEARIRRHRPHVLLTQLEGADRVAEVGRRLGVPTLIWIHDPEFHQSWDELQLWPGLAFVACSDFVAQEVRSYFDTECSVLRPPLDRSRFVAPERTGDLVTFINPVPEKGVEVALEVARLLPHREFLFQEGWPLTESARSALEAEVARLPNVRLEAPTRNMRRVYGRTRLLLMPSRWDEALGMVVVEANANGIPVVASRVGGLPEAVGDGGLLLKVDASEEAWAEAVEGLLSDEATYRQAADAAYRNASRDEFESVRVVERFFQTVEEVRVHATVG